MAESMEAVTTRSLSLALDAAALRQQLHAANVAQASTPGYRPLRLDFEALVEDARRSLQAGGAIQVSTLDGISLAPQVTEQAGVQLDLELAGMARNATQFQVLATALNRHFAVLGNAVADGRR